MTLKFYTNLAEELKLKVRKFWEIPPTFVEVKWKKLVGGEGLLAETIAMNRMTLLRSACIHCLWYTVIFQCIRWYSFVFVWLSGSSSSCYRLKSVFFSCKNRTTAHTKALPILRLCSSLKSIKQASMFLEACFHFTNHRCVTECKMIVISYVKLW